MKLTKAQRAALESRRPARVGTDHHIPVIVRMESRGPGNPRAPLLVFPTASANAGTMVVCSFIDGHSEASTVYLWGCPLADDETAQAAIVRFRNAYPHEPNEQYRIVKRDTPTFRAARYSRTR